MSRKVDGLNRVVLPLEVRKELGIKENDSVKVMVAGNTVVLEKVHDVSACIFCGGNKDIAKIQIKGHEVMMCLDCMDDIINCNPEMVAQTQSAHGKDEKER